MRAGPKLPLLLAAALGLASALAIASDLLPWLRGPAPYPPEWQWEYRRLPATPRLLASIACAGGLLALLPVRRRTRLAILASVVLGFGFEFTLLGLEPEGALRAIVRRTLSRTDTSYLTVAASDLARDPLEFLDRHAELLPELRRVGKHAATHPPGPVLYYRGLLALCASARNAALAGGLLILLLSAAAAIPIAALARLAGADEPAALRTAVLWNLLPGPALMSPQFDQALALPVAAAAALAASAIVVGPRSKRGLLLAVAAGLLAGLSLYVSYGAMAFLPFAALPAIVLVVEERQRLRRAAETGVLVLAGVSAVVGLTMALGHEPLRAARIALAIHRETFTRPRSYGLWLGFDALDYGLFLGVPVAVLAVLGLARSLTALVRGQGRPLDRMRVTAAALFVLLVLSGTTRGEVGRIWIPLMPVVLVAALARPEKEKGPTTQEALVVGLVLALQCLVIRSFWLVP